MLKGIVLAGGTGSRLYPLSKVTNKHLLPIANKPMIQHAIDKFTASNIKDILVVSGKEHLGHIIEYLGSGKDFDCSLTYRVQDEAGGIAEALGLADGFVGKNDRMAVILGDNIFEDSLADYAKEYMKQSEGAMILLKEVDNPERFGIARIEGKSITEIIEKPKRFIGKLAVTGIYFYDYNVFNIISKIEKSDRGEFEITDVNNGYLLVNRLSYRVLKGWWTDAGTFKSYQVANKLAWKK